MNETYGLLLSDDLIFTSRIVGTAAALGLTLRTAKTAVELQRQMQQAPPRCIILDLQSAGGAIDELARAALGLTPRPFLVGYGSHVDVATLTKARAAGLDIVWPRSKFVDELEASLPHWFGQ
jgi:ActR/RegA family two-component response regulator